MDSLATAYQQAVDLDDFPGAVIAAKDATGEFEYVNAFGQRTLLDGTKKDLQASDVLTIFSGTKIVTAIAVMQCVEQKHFTLDEDISRVLPRFADIQVLTEIGEDNEHHFEDKKKPITLRRLMTHSAGTSYEPFNPPLDKWRTLRGEQAFHGETVMQRHGTPLGYQPGTRFIYGAGVDWAGRAVEQVHSTTLEGYFREHIFKPLGITRASFWPTKDPSIRERMVDLNPTDPNGAGLAGGGGNDVKSNTKECLGGAGLYISASDYLKILHSLLANDGKLLSSQSVEEMFQPNLEDEAHRFLKDMSSTESSNQMFGQGIPPGVARDYGLSGLLLQDDLPGWYGKGTMTWAGSLNTIWFIDRKNGLCGVVSMQLYMRDNFAEQAKAGYVYKPHREGAMNWVDTQRHYAQIFREGIYDVYNKWKKESR